MASEGPRRVVVVGASAAGIFTAESLRRHGFAGEIVVCGDEAPYDRPPLSKQVLKGEWTPDKATLMPPTRFANIDADIRIGVRATGLNIAAQEVSFADGTRLQYDELVVATGVHPRRLPCGGSEVGVGGAHVLRTIQDALDVRAAIDSHGELLIIGAGFIGLEVAASAVKVGARVTVIEPLPEPLAARIGAHAARRIIDRHRAEGVEIRTGTGVLDISLDEDGALISLADGSSVRTRAVLAGIGCQPTVGWLEGSGLTLDNGLVCDQYCQAAPHVWAAGDVANWYHSGLGRSLRIEHRTNAQEQAEAVARNILGAAVPFTPVPFFWSDQYDIKLQFAGILPPDCIEEAVLEGDAEGASFVRGFYQDGDLVGVLGWNSARALPAYRRKLNFQATSSADEDSKALAGSNVV